METFLWVIAIHVIELVGVAFYLLIRKNSVLEKVVLEQQEFIDSMSIIINNSDSKLKELEFSGALEADDEVGFFFKNLKEIQSIISEFNSYRKK